MKSPRLWAALLATISGAACHRSTPEGQAPGFKDLVKNPGLLDEFEQQRLEQERRIAGATAWDDARVAREVHAFIFETATERRADSERRVLQSLGSRTHQAVLGELANPKYGAQWTTPTDTEQLPEAPFNRACTLLDDKPPASAVPPIAAFVTSPSEYIRKDAALVLGATGSATAAEPLKLLLTDSDEYVRAYVITGLSRALEAGRLEPACMEALFPALCARLPHEDDAGEVAVLLLKLDRSRAQPAILADSLFNARSPVLYPLLHALNTTGTTAPRASLLAIIAQLRTGDLKYPRGQALGQAFHALGRHAHSDDVALLEAALDHPAEDVAEGAASGLLAAKGLDDATTYLFEQEETRGFANLTKPQRHCLALLGFDAEIRNGGLAQYFLNSSGDQWPQALEGLDEIHHETGARILRAAVKKFGFRKPSTDSDKRQEQLARVFRNDEDVFSDLETTYYQAPERLAVLMARYMIKSPGDFRPAQP